MKEIRFRAIDRIEKKIVRWGCIGALGDLGLDAFWGFIEADPDRYDVQEYTGLHDKNGKEIYEGDIVLQHNSADKKKYIVEYENGCPTCAHGCFDSKGRKDGEEVIGNIYSNPELLNPK